MTDHPEIFKDVLKKVFQKVKNGKITLKLGEKIIDIDGTLPFLVRRKKI